MQIWMTYDELGQLMACSFESARYIAHDRRLDRKRSRDGLTRAKLDDDLSRLLIDRLRNTAVPATPDDRALDTAILELRRVHQVMIAHDGQRTADKSQQLKAGQG